MLIRTTALAIVLTACASPLPSSPDAGSTAETADPIINTCNPVNIACLPTDPIANRWCQIICDLDGNQGYCLEYSSIEIAYCAAHPDKFFSSSPLRYCDIDGNPTWYTHCEPGWLP